MTIINYFYVIKKYVLLILINVVILFILLLTVPADVIAILIDYIAVNLFDNISLRFTLLPHLHFSKPYIFLHPYHRMKDFGARLRFFVLLSCHIIVHCDINIKARFSIFTNI